MDLAFRERQWFMWSMVVSIFFGCLQIIVSHISVLSTITSLGAFSAPNIMFALFRFAPVVIPAAFFIRGSEVTGRGFMAKILRLKLTIGIFAALSLFGVIWVLYFLNINDFSDLFNFDEIFEYQSSANIFFIGNYVIWGTYRLCGTIFSLVLFLLLIAEAVLLHHHRVLVASVFTTTMLFRLLAPLVLRLAVYHTFYTSTWLLNNAFSTLSMIAFTVGICAAARSDAAWLELIWGELPPESFNDN